ncbi:hypothetical protein FA09DRAFT_314866 [Tilletiopsis washingtonensis]|uniref:Nucleic acid-binding protein n=1 Tax=Tilletiopsis washingtonensis TaxID=58919 RepID=A0A316ZEU2_9BASI|nr:hypothetical protein FA09DRAFT_314866 [Tilletiopsis washingtonensis]PWO00271.1 hypothetical protein FA09DRAFT_314866 [Tilletiopsis washingtonensis]
MFSALRSAVPARRAAVRALSTSAPRADVARMQLLGRLVADPETRQTRAGKDYVRYVVATTDPLGPPGEEGGERPEPTTSYHNIFAFGESAVQRLSTIGKGTQVLVDADFRLARQPSEDGAAPAQTNILVQHRSIAVISRPKPAEPAA